MRLRFASLNRQQISTSRVTKVTPCATAANPPTKTNSTCASTSLRVSSLRFCIPFLHRGAQRIGESQGVVIGLHPLPRFFCEAIVEQGKIDVVRGFAVRPCWFLHCENARRFFTLGLIQHRAHHKKVCPRLWQSSLGASSMTGQTPR